MLTLSLLLKQSKEFQKVLSRYYPVPPHLLETYSDEWDWALLSENKSLDWDQALIARFSDRWNWGYGGLSSNEWLPWSAALLAVFNNHWSWYHLGRIPKVVNNEAMLTQCFLHWKDWDQEHLFSRYLPPMNEESWDWVEDFFENCPQLNWQWFSCYAGFPWTGSFIQNHFHQLHWENLSANPGLPWSTDFIYQYHTYWDWERLSSNTGLPWDRKLLAAFAERWVWKSLSVNTGIVWNSDLLLSFASRLYWSYPVYCDGTIEAMTGLINNLQIQWTPALFEQCRTAIELHYEELDKEYDEAFFPFDTSYWTVDQSTANWSIAYLEMLMDLEKTGAIQYINWKSLCRYARHIWDAALIHRLEPILLKNAYELAQNPNFPWDEYLEKFASAISNQGMVWISLCYHPGLKLGEELLEKYKERWNWNELSENVYVTLSIIDRFKDQWNWEKLSRNRSLTVEILTRYKSKLNWWWLVQNGRVTLRDSEVGSDPNANETQGDKPLIEVLVDEALLKAFLSH